MGRQLFEEWSAGTLTARNRIVRSATAESLCTRAGAPSKRLVDLYRGLGEGGAGIVITGYAYTRDDGKPAERSMDLGREVDDAAFAELVSAVHDEGGRIVAQLVYGGSKTRLSADDPRRIAGAAEGEPNADVLGPSAVANPATGIVPREATPEELVAVCTSFAQAAARAQRLGFDGVEVHAAHGYLLSQFLDGRFNKRTDEYGGSLENRARLACGCVRAVRAQVGPTWPVFAKINSSDVLGDALGETGGLGEEESLRVAEWLVEAGATCIDVSGDWHAVEVEDITGEPFFGSFGTRLAQRVDVPVIVTGGWRDIEVIERYLEGTGIAAFGMSRPLIREAYLPARWRDGDRRPSQCTSCGFCLKHSGIPCIENRLD